MSLDWIFSDDGLGLGRILGYVAPPALIVAFIYLGLRNYLHKRKAGMPGQRAPAE
jgi:hypothetical protein